jgi:hypothetical protein
LLRRGVKDEGNTSGEPTEVVVRGGRGADWSDGREREPCSLSDNYGGFPFHNT